jgi:hypothetical protein
MIGRLSVRFDLSRRASCGTDDQGAQVVVIDLIAGMTEPQVIEAYRQVMGAWPWQSPEGLPA